VPELVGDRHGEEVLLFHADEDVAAARDDLAGIALAPDLEVEVDGSLADAAEKRLDREELIELDRRAEVALDADPG
jgi:hypothetical protein